MDNENPLNLRKAPLIRDRWLILGFLPLYILFGPVALYAEGSGLVFLIILLAVCLGFIGYRRSWKIGIAALLNPLIALPVFYSFQAIFRYAWGRPTLIYCSYKEKPLQFDESKEVYVKSWDDDCDWDMLYKLSSDLNNWITEGLMENLGKPGIIHLVFFILAIFLTFAFLSRTSLAQNFFRARALKPKG